MVVAARSTPRIPPPADQSARILAIELDLRRQPIGVRHCADENKKGRAGKRFCLAGVTVRELHALEPFLAFHTGDFGAFSYIDVRRLLNPADKIMGHAFA